jgi:hypothetical protein
MRDMYIIPRVVTIAFKYGGKISTPVEYPPAPKRDASGSWEDYRKETKRLRKEAEFATIYEWINK